MEYSGFYDGDTLYGQEEFNRYFDNLYESGVSLDDSGNMTLGVTGGPGSVQIGTGFAIVKGFYYYNDSAKSLTVTPDAQYSRIDRVVLRANLLTGPISAILKQGTPGSSPQPPALQRDSSVWEISLARITVTPAGAITVADERFDQSVCGAVRPKNLTEYNDMIAEFQRQWEEWFASQQGTGWRNIYVQASEPEGEVNGSIWIDT